MKVVSLKVQTPFVVSMLVAVALLTSSLLNERHMGSLINQYQQKKQQELNRDFDILLKETKEQMAIQAEQIVLFSRKKQLSDIDELFLTIEKVWFELNLISSVEGVSLHHQADRSFYKQMGSVQKRHAVILANNVFETSAPVSKIICTTHCSIYQGIPINAENEVWVLIIEASLSKFFLDLAELSEVELALVYKNDNEQLSTARQIKNWGMSILIVTNSEKSIEQFTKLSEKHPKITVPLSLSESIDGSNYYVWARPLDESAAKGFYLLFLDNTDNESNTLEAQNRQGLILQVIVIVLIAIIMIGITIGPIQRLQKLARLLPLIGKQNYKAVRKSLTLRNSTIRNEIDQLETSSLRLVYELDLMDKEIKEHTKNLEFMALYDNVTGLPNRNKFIDDFKKLLSRKQHALFEEFVLFFDLDGFKSINDNLGHDAGDLLLSEVGKRLLIVLDSMDSLYRFGGDEFAIIIRSSSEDNSIHQILVTIFKLFESDIVINDTPVVISPSMGVVKVTDEIKDVSQVLKQADMAMYEAKKSGKNCYRFFDESMREETSQRFFINNSFPNAIVNNEFDLYFQPIIELATGKLIKFEALVRWFTKDSEQIFPNYFIPILEESDKILILGDWVAYNACKSLNEYQTIYGQPICMSINISAQQLTDGQFITRLLSHCREFNIETRHIELEITETSLINDFERAVAWMNEVVRHGFLLSIDDFGTGYSSLSYLTTLPFHTVKLDRSFIQPLSESKLQSHVVGAVVDMVQELGKEIVAEGIETLVQYQMLAEMGCNYGQGYLMARPLTYRQVLQKFKDNDASKPWYDID